METGRVPSGSFRHTPLLIEIDLSWSCTVIQSIDGVIGAKADRRTRL